MSQVEVTVTSPTDIDTFDLGLRMPNWVSSPSVPITINGSAAQPGQPGSYVHVVMTPWPKGATTIRFELPMAVQAHRYGGADQFPGAQSNHNRHSCPAAYLLMPSSTLSCHLHILHLLLLTTRAAAVSAQA